jgi:uncharacterized protein with GYD domain
MAARLTADGTQGAFVAPAERAEAAGRLIARIGGTLIGCYRTSGDDDVLLVFEAASYEEAVPALDAAAAGSGVIDLRTVRSRSPGRAQGMRSAQWLARSALRLSHWKSIEQRTSCREV